MRPCAIRWCCPYCGAEKPSDNGTGSDVDCCGERGHAVAHAEDCACEDDTEECLALNINP